MTTQPLDKVVIATVPDRAAAEVIVDLLVTAGIDAEVAAQPTDVYFGGVPGVDVRVAGHDEARARAVIDSLRTPDALGEHAPGDAGDVPSAFAARRQWFALAVLPFLPLPASCYYARRNAIGHALLLVYVASLAVAFTVWPSAVFLTIATKGLDAWLGPVLLAHAERRRNPSLWWAVVVSGVCLLASVATYRAVDRKEQERRVRALVRQLQPALVRGDAVVLPRFPATPEGAMAELWARFLLEQKQLQKQLAALSTDEPAYETRALELRQAMARAYRILSDREVALARQHHAQPFLVWLFPEAANSWPLPPG